MKTQYTAGPWRIVERPEQGKLNGRRITVDAQSGIIADADWNTPATNKANAALIAAAPCLLEACESALVALENPGSDNWRATALTDIRQAINKALIV